MINRIIIRIKVLQIVYAYYQKNSKDLKSAEHELLLSLQKSYDLYHYFLFLIVLLTNTEQKRLDKQKHKLLKTEFELLPNTRLADNRLAEQLSKNKQLGKFIHEKGTFWEDDDDVLFIRNMLNQILQSDIYKEYLKSENNYESDKEFWRKVFKNIILENEELINVLEDRSIYWEGDWPLVGTFALKTIKQLHAESDANLELLSMFRDSEDKEFALKLLHRSILEEEENIRRINQHTKNWDIERVAVIDLYIMQIALAELQNFPSIPVSVTLNEYIDLARYYSTPKSPVFINGILDGITNELRSEAKLFKD